MANTKKTNWTVINSAGMIVLRTKNTTYEEAVEQAAKKDNVMLSVARDLWLTMKTEDEGWFQLIVQRWDKPE